MECVRACACVRLRAWAWRVGVRARVLFFYNPIACPSVRLQLILVKYWSNVRPPVPSIGQIRFTESPPKHRACARVLPTLARERKAR